MKQRNLSIATAGIAGLVVALQWSQNSKLKSEITQLETTIVEYREREATGSRRLSAIADQEPGDPTGDPTDITPGENPELLSSLDLEGADIGANLTLILAERDPLQRMGALLAYVSQLDDSDVPVALEELRQNTPEWDPDARVAAQLMLTRWGKADPEGALAYASALGRDRAGRDATVILSAIAASDPQRAVAWLEDPDNKLVNQPWLGQFLAGSLTKEWVRQDPDAALEWAMNAPDNQRSGAYSGVLGSIAATDPKRASSLATELPEGDARREIIGQIARAWSETSPAEAIQWADTLEGDERRRASNEAIGKWAQSAPEEAASFVDSLAADQRSEGMLDRVANQWARQEPENAAHWLSAQEESADKADAMGDVMWNWTTADPVAASSWLLEQEPGNSRDEGIVALARVTFDEEPESAITWAAHMSDEKKRRDSVTFGVNVWLDRDPEAASQWLEATDTISQEERDRILAEREERKARENNP